MSEGTAATTTSESGNVEEILKERGSRYGSFDDNAANAQAIKNAMRHAVDWDSKPVWVREGLDLIATKISRLLTGDASYEDNYADIQGYAKLMQGFAAAMHQDGEEISKRSDVIADKINDALVRPQAGADRSGEFTTFTKIPELLPWETDNMIRSRYNLRFGGNKDGAFLNNPKSSFLRISDVMASALWNHNQNVTLADYDVINILRLAKEAL